MNNEERIWEYFKSMGLTDAGAAGLIGNLYAESLLNPKNLQNTYERKLGYSDESYTKAVDDGDYANFSTDSAGYGLAQWTYKTRKASLFAFSKIQNKSIGDLMLQLNFLKNEMEKSYSKLWKFLKTTNNIYDATIQVMVQYESPADQSNAAKNKRHEYAEKIYERNFKESKETSKEIILEEQIIDAPEFAPIEEEKKEIDLITNIELLPQEKDDTITKIVKEIQLGKWGQDWESNIIEEIKKKINGGNKVEQNDNLETYRVVAGDTLTKIANRFNTTIEKIIKDNSNKYPSISRNYINIGWFLKV